MTHGGAYDPPNWFIPFGNTQAIADELRCSVPEALSDDPVIVELRRFATLKLVAQMDAKRRQEPGNAAK